MLGTDRPPNDVLVLRGWVERGHPHPLRIRILRRSSGGTTWTSTVAYRPEDVLAVIADWLEELSTL
jgi:hypothetical protein